MPTPESAAGGGTTIGDPVTFLTPGAPHEPGPITTPFVSVGRRDDGLTGSTIERHVQGLHDHPDATFSFTLPAAGRSSASRAPDGWLDLVAGAGGAGGRLDGRQLARALLFAAGAPPLVPSPTLIRTSAIHDRTQHLGALSGGDGTTVDWYRLVLQLLVEGPAWLDPVPAECPPPADDPATTLWPEWAEVLATGAGLGLLDQPGDTVRALIAATRRDAELVRRHLGGAGADRRGAIDPTVVVRRALASWRAMSTDETGAGRPTVGAVSTGTGADGDLHGGRSDDHHPLPPLPATDWLPEPAQPLRRTEPLRTFVIVAPDYTEGHGGVVALHRLCDRLNAIGCDAFIHPIGTDATTRPGWRTPLRRGRSVRDAVVVYPEIVTGNLLGADRVVRWLLNRPGRFTGLPMDEGPSDLVVTFSRQVSADHPVLTVPLIDPTVFFPKSRPGSGALLWIGKGALPPGFNRAGTTLITSDWPGERRHFADVLRAAGVLYTCDWLTAVIDEALMCGTPVVLVGDQEWKRDEITVRPGMAWEYEGTLDHAREDVGRYFPAYLAELATVDDGIGDFVQLVNEHFAEAPP